MKILTQVDFMTNAFQDFLRANFGKVNEVANKGKFVLELTDSQVKGSYIKDGKKVKLKPISYQSKINNSR